MNITEPVRPLLLVVDDDPMIRLLIEGSLQPHGFTVRQAENGEEALDLIAQCWPDMVLLDINMPGIDGIETCSRIRKLPQAQLLPVLMLTGQDDNDAIVSAFQAGASDFITKPIYWPILIHHVRYMLRAGQALIELYHHHRIQTLLSALTGLAAKSFNSPEALAEEILSVLVSELSRLGYSDSAAIYLCSAQSPIAVIRGDSDDYPPQLDSISQFGLMQVDEYQNFSAYPLNAAHQFQGVLLVKPRDEQHCQALKTVLMPAVAEKISQLLEHVRVELETRLAAEVFSNSLDAIAITDRQGVLLRVNQVFEATTGYLSSEILGQNILQLKSERQDALSYQIIKEALQQTGKWQGELWSRRKSGDSFPCWLNISGLRDSEGEVNKYIAVFSDISEQKEQEKRIQNLAYYDNLTGLANRTLLNDHLQLALVRAGRHQECGALLFIDLDRFKSINDSLGHVLGDQLLEMVGERLKNLVRNGDTVARQGGDEFIVLLTDLPCEQVQTRIIVTKIAESVLEMLATPMMIGHHEFSISASIGIAFYPYDAQSGIDLIKHADMAMYEAKQKGRNCYEFFQSTMAEKEFQRFTLERLLTKAIEHEEFSLNYQPQVDITSGKIVSAECLLRWHNPILGWVSPLDFIPLAEETGLIYAIGDWVLTAVCRQVSVWEKTGLLKKTGCQFIAVNISAKQFSQQDFAQKVCKIIHDSGLTDWSLLELEITEGCVMHSSYESTRTLAYLRSVGIRVSIDDFGTGYSSLSYLKNFPLDTLKIDRSFIVECLADRNSQAIVKAIIAMAKGLGLNAIAEGVENDEQLAFLKEQGCHLYQGFLFSKPVVTAAFEQLLTQSV